MQFFRADILIPQIEGQLENIRQQTSKLSPLTKVLNALLLSIQHNSNPVNIDIVSEAIACLEEKIRVLEDILINYYRISKDKRIYSYRANLLLNIPYPHYSVKQILIALIAWGEDLDSLSYRQARSIRNELFKIKNDLTEYRNKISDI